MLAWRCLWRQPRSAPKGHGRDLAGREQQPVGTTSFLFPSGTPPVSLTAGTSPSAAAMAFFVKYAAIFQMIDPTSELMPDDSGRSNGLQFASSRRPRVPPPCSGRASPWSSTRPGTSRSSRGSTSRTFTGSARTPPVTRAGRGCGPGLPRLRTLGSYGVNVTTGVTGRY